MTMDARRTSPRVGPSAYNPATMGAACSRNSGESDCIENRTMATVVESACIVPSNLAAQLTYVEVSPLEYFHT